jgi:2-keto-4-pentenoate hydratase/2-oxohepta-3-ene-1,7-dioic acid hydratase in catechol pathway
MRICRFRLKSGATGEPRLGLVSDDGVRDVTTATDALPPLRWPLPPGDLLIANLAKLRPELERLAAAATPIPFDQVTLLSPVANPGKFVCGAGNWKFMGAPFGMLGFMFKASSALAGPGEGVQLRWPDRETLHEPELAIVIGRECSNVGEAEALDYVAGYACALDMTLKKDNEDYAFCKSFDTYGMIGPWMVTADEIADPSKLSYKFWVDGELRGERSFGDLTASPAEMIAFASSAMTLYPGDLILSGAADVAPVFPGQVMRLEIPRIGTMEVPVTVSANARKVAAPAAS